MPSSNDINEPLEESENDDPESFESAGHTYALGLVTKEFSSLEFLLHTVIWSLIGEQEIGRVITARLGMERLEDLLLPLARERLGDETRILEPFQQAAIELRQAREARNIFIHSTWYTRGEAEIGRFRLHRKKGEIVLDDQPSTVDHVMDAVQQIQSARHQLLGIVLRHFLSSTEEK